jgi:hypothetical protein
MLEYIVIHYDAKLSILAYPLTPHTTFALACIGEIGEYGLWLAIASYLLFHGCRYGIQLAQSFINPPLQIT